MYTNKEVRRIAQKVVKFKWVLTELRNLHGSANIKNSVVCDRLGEPGHGLQIVHNGIRFARMLCVSMEPALRTRKPLWLYRCLDNKTALPLESLVVHQPSTSSVRYASEYQRTHTHHGTTVSIFGFLVHLGVPLLPTCHDIQGSRREQEVLLPPTCIAAYVCKDEEHPLDAALKPPIDVVTWIHVFPLLGVVRECCDKCREMLDEGAEEWTFE